MLGIPVLGEPAEGSYHFEGEYCQVTCGTDKYGIVYQASHEILVCHDHMWVTKQFEAATPTCTAKPCHLYPSLSDQEIPNTEFECSPDRECK